METFAVNFWKISPENGIGLMLIRNVATTIEERINIYKKHMRDIIENEAITIGERTLYKDGTPAPCYEK